MIALARNQSGSVPIVLSIALLPILSMVGMGVDYSVAVGQRDKLRSAADASILLAVTGTQATDSASNVSGDYSTVDPGTKPIQDARALFDYHAKDISELTGKTISFKIEKKAGVYTGTATYSGTYPLKMPNPTSVKSVNIAGLASATISETSTGYMDVYSLLDISQSMGIGATPADITKMVNLTGCAFGCHVPSSKSTYYDLPKSKGVTFRIDVLRSAVTNMIDSASKTNATDPHVRIGLYGFNHKYTTLADISTNYTELKTKALAIDLTSENDATNIRGALEWLNANKVTSSGDGKTADKPKKFVFLVTDGVEDYHTQPRVRNFPGPYASWGNMGSIEPTSCDALKAKGVTVAVLYTTYAPFSGWQYNDLVKPYAHLIAPRLKACASPDFFYEAKDAAEIQSAFGAMFKKAVNTTQARLSK